MIVSKTQITLFSARLRTPIFQSKSPSYSQGVGSYYDAEPVPKTGLVGETASKPTGKRNCPTGMAKTKY